MAQFDVYRNTNKKTSLHIPYLLDVQANLLDQLVTRAVIPLLDAAYFGKAAEHLNPLFKIEGNDVIMSTAELAGIPNSLLSEKISSLQEHRNTIISALDFLFTGI